MGHELSLKTSPLLKLVKKEYSYHSPVKSQEKSNEENVCVKEQRTGNKSIKMIFFVFSHWGRNYSWKQMFYY